MDSTFMLSPVSTKSHLRCSKSQESVDPCKKSDGPYKIQSLDRAVSLLHELSSSPNPLLLTGVAANTGLHKKSTTQRFLRILQGYDLVYRRTDGRYHLGLRLHDLGEKAIKQFDPRDKAAAPFRRLVYKLKRPGALVVLRGKMTVFHNTDLGLKPSFCAPIIGSSTPAHLSAAGSANWRSTSIEHR